MLVQKPEPRTPENLGFKLHQGVGLASAGILVIFWAFGAGPAPGARGGCRWHQIKWHDVLKCVFSTQQSVGSIDEERERMP